MIEVMIALMFLSVLFGTGSHLLLTSLRAVDASMERGDARGDISYAMAKTARPLREAAQGSVSQHSSTAHTIEYDDLSGGTYVLYLYNAADTTFDSNYTESTYDLRRANIAGGWTEIIYDEFESDFGNWTDGGSDCIRYTGSTYAHQGSAAVNIQDNTSSSVVSTSDLALSGYSEIQVDFWYYARSMEGGEDFWLQISTNGGSGYSTVQRWRRGADFNNNTFYEESVTITGYTLSDQTRIRFRCDASKNNDDVYLDEIRISASTGSAESPAAGEGLLILRNLVSPDAAEPATDLTISGNEVTLDLVVQRDGQTVTMRTKVRPRNL